MADQTGTVVATEFREHMAKSIVGSDPIPVSHRGKVIGFYVPVPPNREETDRILQQLEAAVTRIRQQTGLSEDEVADLFDLSKPIDG